jgi:hypothetical protein
MSFRKWRIYALLAFMALLFLAVIALSAEADNHEVIEFTNNDDVGSAIWIEPPYSLNAVHMWTRGGEPNNDEDWWKFNASDGKHVQINFRKYHLYQGYEDPYLGGTYNLNYRVSDAGLNQVYHYSRTYTNNPNDLYRRDSWSWIVPESMGGMFYIQVWVTTSQSREAYYWLNLTVEDPGNMNAVSQFNGTLALYNNFTADYDSMDYFLVDLNADDTTSDLVTLELYKDEVDTDLVLEIWESIPGVRGNQFHLLNRSTSSPANNITVEFIATHTGTYTVRMIRDFWDLGSSNYTLSVSFGSKSHDGDNLMDDGMNITYVQKLRFQTIEMGYDTHDWYKVQVLEGDTIFKVIVDIDDENVGNGQGYELVVYNEGGGVKWADSSVAPGPSYREGITLPPTGTTTIFDKNETLYIRFSADAGVTDRSIDGFRSSYDIEFVLTNRAPELIMPFNETYEWDEDGSISIYLDEHFFDPDGDKMEYFLFNRTQGWVYDVPALLYWGWLNVTSPPQWFGQVTWSLKAQDEGQTSDLHKFFIDFTFIVHSVPDLPIANDTLYKVCDEEESVTANLNNLFYDVDDGPEGVLTFGYTDTGITEVQVTLDEETGALELVPDADVFGVFIFDFYAEDIAGVPTVGQVELRVIPVNDIPRITSEIDRVVMDEGGDPIEVNMSKFFHDVDGDDLLYTFVVPDPDSGNINVYHKNNVITEHRVIIEITDDAFYGAILVNVTCKDAEDTTVKQDMLIVIYNVPDPPSIDFYPLGNPPDIEEGDFITFKVTDVVDADLPEFGLHTYTWYIDGEEVLDLNISEVIFTAGFDDAGSHTVAVIVTDPSGLTALQEPIWTFMVTDKNRVPTIITITVPTKADEDEKVTLTAEGSDEDEDELTYAWYLVGTGSDRELGVGKTIETKIPAGTHSIEVVVTDGKGGMATKMSTIKVAAVEETGGMGLMLGIIVAVVIAVVIAVVVMMKRGGGEAQPDVKMDLDSLQQEYDPSAGRETKEIEGYDPTPQDWEEYDKLE